MDLRTGLMIIFIIGIVSVVLLVVATSDERSSEAKPSSLRSEKQ